MNIKIKIEYWKGIFIFLRKMKLLYVSSPSFVFVKPSFAIEQELVMSG